MDYVYGSSMDYCTVRHGKKNLTGRSRFLKSRFVPECNPE